VRRASWGSTLTKFVFILIRVESKEIAGCPGSFEIEPGNHDVICVGKDTDGKFHGIVISYGRVSHSQPGDARISGDSKLLFENEDIRIVATYSKHKQFDGQLMDIMLFRK
jgi:hypothetical protein